MQLSNMTELMNCDVINPSIKHMNCIADATYSSMYQNITKIFIVYNINIDKGKTIVLLFEKF